MLGAFMAGSVAVWICQFAAHGPIDLGDIALLGLLFVPLMAGGTALAGTLGIERTELWVVEGMLERRQGKDGVCDRWALDEIAGVQVAPSAGPPTTLTQPTCTLVLRRTDGSQVDLNLRLPERDAAHAAAAVQAVLPRLTLPGVTDAVPLAADALRVPTAAVEQADAPVRAQRR